MTMLKSGILLLVFAGSANAAIYTFEDDAGDFMINGWTRAQHDDYFDRTLAQNQAYIEECAEYAPREVCEEEGNSVEGIYHYGRSSDAEAFYEAEFQYAIDSYSIRKWVTDGLVVRAGSYPFFAYGRNFSYLGGLQTFGDGVGPRSVEMTLSADQGLVSIDLSMGRPGFSGAIVITAGTIRYELDSAFDGTFYFGDAFAGISTFSISSGINSIDTNIWGFSYGNLVTRSNGGALPPAAVPLPAGAPLLAFALMALGVAARRRIRT